MHEEKLARKAQRIHAEIYGTEPTSVSYAPGRIEVLGNHTDYNEGTTFSCAINMGHCFCISRSDQPGVRLTANDIRVTTEFDPSTNVRLEKKFQWANYVKGVFHYLRNYGIEVDCADCSFLGSIPMGAGLSSSAALEVAAAFAAVRHTGKELGKKEIGLLSQKAESRFARCNCGLLDQFSSIYGVRHGLIHSDFRTLETYPVKISDEAVFLVINPGIQHTLADSPYNARRRSCEQAVSELGSLLGREVKALRDISWQEFIDHRDQIDPEAARRASHVIREITLVETGVKLLNEGKLEQFGKSLFDSHESSRTAFENSCTELDMVVEAACEAGALGARLSGGGWGGSAVALVRAAEMEAFREKIVAICQEKRLHPAVETIIPSAGAAIII